MFREENSVVDSNSNRFTKKIKKIRTEFLRAHHYHLGTNIQNDSHPTDDAVDKQRFEGTFATIYKYLYKTNAV